MRLSSQDFVRSFAVSSHADAEYAQFYSLPRLEALGYGSISRLPVCLRIVLESLLRHLPGGQVSEAEVLQLAYWQPQGRRTEEVPFIVSRILLQDFTGVPLLCDLAAMRDAVQRLGGSPGLIEPLVPVDLVVDHSVQVDHHREHDALALNMQLEFERNAERYRFIRWGMGAFRQLQVVPPGVGIVHQVNLERLARGVRQDGRVCSPDTLVGTDSHTTMINALGVVGWGVGGIEAEAGMLGQPIRFLMPDVVGVHLSGRLGAGVTATDLALVLTERLRKARVSGKFVEFHGEGAASLSLPDRATVANMAPEYGATIGYFPPDEVAAGYLAATGRSDAEVELFRQYFRAQQLYGMPRPGQIDYSFVVELDLGSVFPSVAGPKRPQDRLDLPDIRPRFRALLERQVADGGYGLAGAALAQQHRLADGSLIGHGAVLIAAITSCTNTSNPDLMLAAGLLARQAVARGLSVAPHVKTSLAPGSRVVSHYLERVGLLAPLEQLGFRVVAYGCTTCIGNTGPLAPEIEALLREAGLIGAAVLSGNRNFEARIHSGVRANFLMSPPLVVAFALAGRVDIDLLAEPLGTDAAGHPVWLRELWPRPAELDKVLAQAADPQIYRRLYHELLHTRPPELWQQLAPPGGQTYDWEAASTYIARPPFLDDLTLTLPEPQPIQRARALLILGDSITTDHISPAGRIEAESPAGRYLLSRGVAPVDFNSYGARRGHHEVMLRGTFANVRLRNAMLSRGDDGLPIEGGLTLLQPEGLQCSVFEAARRYQQDRVPVLVFAGEDYGSGSSRDWAAKGTRLLGVRAVIAVSFERIHRANLIGMGVLPLQFSPGDSPAGLGLRGDEYFDLAGVEGALAPRQQIRLRIHRPSGQITDRALLLRVDTPTEIEYLRHGGILPCVVRQRLAGGGPSARVCTMSNGRSHPSLR
ncbi:MAG: aconitate hydratase AcnA [Pseudomonadota bacterium]